MWKIWKNLFDEHVVAAFIDGRKVGHLDVIEVGVVFRSIQQIVQGKVVAPYLDFFDYGLYVVVAVLIPDGAVAAVSH